MNTVFTMICDTLNYICFSLKTKFLLILGYEDASSNCVKHTERCVDLAYKTLMRKQCGKSCRICGGD